jgi:hypothetical protein
MAEQNPTLLARFWSKVEKLGPDECWPWTATHNHHGYGHFNLADDRIVRAHRLAWEFSHGAIPAGLWVLHKCDYRPCCNPKHLFLGTPQDNSSDMVQKGRHVKTPSYGEKNGQAKLTEEASREIRAAAAIEPHRRVAARFGISQPTVSRIARGATWKHVV